MTTSRSRVALALQGGAAHGAFTWGVLDHLLENGSTFDSVCGVSSGAILGTMMVQGLVRGGRDGARAAMRKVWERVAEAHMFSPMQAGSWERWLWGSEMSNALLWQGVELTMRLFSPSQLNPFGHNPMRPVLAALLDRDALTHPSAPRLIVSATDAETGEAVLFENDAIDVEVLLASCCLPFVFPAVQIAGRAYWDGGYSGNPPLAPLLSPTPPDELVLIRAQPKCRPGVPTTPMEVNNRLNEIACQTGINTELAALPPSVRLTSYDADAALTDLPISSKFNGEAQFLGRLFDAGRQAAGDSRSGAGVTAAGDHAVVAFPGLKDRPPASAEGSSPAR